MDLIEEISEFDKIDDAQALAKTDPASRDLKQAEAKTDEAAQTALKEIEQPNAYDKIDPAAITDAPPVAEKVSEAAQEAGVAQEKKGEPNPVLESIYAVLAFEKKAMGQLAAQEQTTKKNLDNIDSLIDISTAITAAGDKDSLELSPDSLALLAKLKSQGINLLEDGVTTLNKDQLIKLRLDASARIEKLRMNVQQNFTKIQTIIQFMNSVNDTGKRIVNEDSRSKSTYIKNQVP